MLSQLTADSFVTQNKREDACMGNYTLSGEKFIIEDYTQMPAFSSFLPGLAGIQGIPVWTFYTNRGQGINSFGIHHKGNAMMEFNPANTAYENTPIKGFRTFVRADGAYFEPFCTYAPTARRRMEIEKNVFSINEESRGLKITVSYCILPGESIGALVRQVQVENVDTCAHALEILDGMAQIIPYGIQNGQYKEMSNLFKSWADIKNIEKNAPLYTMRASSDDSAEVSEIEGGYFYLAVKGGKLQEIIYDKDVIFGRENSMVIAVNFLEKGMAGVKAQKQCFANKIPCGFVPIEARLQPGEKLEFTAYAGFAPSAALLNQKAWAFCAPGFGEEKFRQARELTASFTKDVWTKTANPLFDQYIEQCYLDNFLRGGYPYVMGSGEKRAVVHLFSRKHGDPERDYNFFSIAGEYYSQGNGNYRDVCQNRRNDVFFCPAIGDFNVHHFYSLIQMDGYNPLEIRPCTFRLDPGQRKEALELVESHVADSQGKIAGILDAPFTPGQISGAIARYQLKVTGSEEELVNGLISLASQQIEAGFGEGYWSDHWDYNLDLVENYLSVYPDKKQELLYEREDYGFYDSVGVIRPRRDTYVNNNGKIRQYGAMYHSPEKEAGPDFQAQGTNWLKDRDGRKVTTNLFGKLITLAVNKFALLDSQGLGVEMEGGKPGWNDACNGLPGLFGSSMPETLELKRVVDFLWEEVKARAAEGKKGPELPRELARFMRDIYGALQENLSSFDYWDKAACLREAFRQETMLRVSGEKAQVSFEELCRILEAFRNKLNEAAARALEIGDGVMPTYFTYEAQEYEALLNEDKSPRISPYGMPGVRVKSFRMVPVPRFLEGPARMLAACGKEDRERASKMCARIRESDIYDSKLKMYKTSESIESMSMENGRVRAFTPGWLERESVFLHMEYKYFLGMLKAGLYDAFYEAVGDALIPFQKPEVYGRSILENSSFLASSANPDPSVHGQGFVSRLSGSTVEMLSMWIGMFLGEGGFGLKEGRLSFTLAPRLRADYFDQSGEAGFTVCGCCRVIYHNAGGRNTYGSDGAEVRSMTVAENGRLHEIQGDTLGEELAVKLRNGEVSRIDAYL